ncbi:MAG TPA: hypothetical protein VNL94_00915 [Candidatus Binatia bacterium]|nr:hypothetical protein [Candidatus Binatia bacterium]
MTWDRSIAPRCNIGPAEVARRRRSAIFFTVVAAAAAVLLIALDAPPAARLLWFPFVTGAAINLAQVFHRFCVAFGALGVENFGAVGEERKVDPQQRAADLRRVAQLVLEGAAVGLGLTLLFVIAPA